MPRGTERPTTGRGRLSRREAFAQALTQLGGTRIRLGHWDRVYVWASTLEHAGMMRVTYARETGVDMSDATALRVAEAFLRNTVWLNVETGGWHYEIEVEWVDGIHIPELTEWAVAEVEKRAWELAEKLRWATPSRGLACLGRGA